MKNAILKKAHQAVFCSLLLAVCSLFLACSEADEEATGSVTISIGGRSSGKAAVSRSTTGYPPSNYPGGNASGPALEQITYKVFFNGSEKSGTKTGETIHFNLAVGTYTVRVEAYEPIGGSQSLYATGEKPNVQIQAGQTTTVQIQMSEAVTVTFDPNGGTLTGSSTVQAGQGDKVSKPSNPTPPSGLIFDGWYEGSSTTPWDFNTNTVPSSNPVSDITLVARYGQTVTIAAISGVTIPAYGGTPVTTISSSANPQYSGTISWSPNDSPFALGKTYTATITLTANAPYTMQGVAANFFTVAGATSVSNSANSGVVTATFPETALNTIALFKTWLDAQPSGNTAATAYTAKVNVASLGGSQSASGSLGNTLLTNANKYVILDLSGSTFTTVDSGAFNQLTNLVGITLSNNVTTISSYAFSQSGLTSITMPNTVTSIVGSAFLGCSSLVSVTFEGTIPSSGVATDAFSGLGDLRDKYLAGGPGTYTRRSNGQSWTTGPAENGTTVPFTSVAEFKEWLAEQGTNTASDPYTLKVNVASLGGSQSASGSLGNALNTNSGIYVVLDLSGSTFTTVDNYSFQMRTNLVNITLPNTVTSIGTQAFMDCSSLVSVTFQGTISGTFATNAFQGIGDLRDKFYATDTANGTPGKYTRASGGTVWTKE
jgi:hypothetical protein